MRIRKYNTGSNILYSGLGDMSIKWENWVSQKLWPTPKLNNFPTLTSWGDSYKNLQLDYYKNNYQADKEKQNKRTSGNQVVAAGTSAATNYATDKVTDKLFDDSELGRGLGTLFSSGVSSAGNTLSDNLLKGTTLTEGLGTNTGASVAGAGAGLAANYLGQGINSLGGNTMLSRGIGQGVATGLGTVGGAAMSNLVLYGTLAGKSANGVKTALIGKAAGAINPYALAMNVVGSGLGAAFGPSKEYGGRYGNITLTMDSVYDTAMVGANFIPGAGQMISGVMALNKGLSNIFGSTDGMTKTDAILGSAFMPAPVKWLNMWGASSTGTFDRQSWLNLLKANSFMGDAFGNLSDKFDLAREEAGKTYGTFSQGAKRDAQRNIDFANYAWGQIMDMANLNEYQNIRSQYMSSINNLRYAQAIQGGWTPLARGKQGMKILNNATNHNMGMRLLSAAALIDNKQMILSAGNGVKIPKLQTAFLPIEKSDNTRVASLHTEQPFTRKQWEEEQLRRNIEQAQRKQTVISSDKRSAYEKLLGQKKATINQLLEQRIKNQESAIKAFLGLSTMVTPSYWVEQTTGQNLGTVGSLAIDLASPFALGKGLQLTGKGLLLVGRGTNKLTRFGISPYTGKWTLFGNRLYRLKPGYLGMNGTPVESRPVKIVRLYRASGTNGNFEASLDGGQEFSGQWFTNNPNKPLRYASMTVKRAKLAGVDNPIELQYVDIPESELSKYRASEILKGRTDIEYEPTEDFLIPLNYPRQRVPLEGYTGNYLQDVRRPLPKLDLKFTIPTITPENAVSITPKQWTAAQDAAIARGDMAEAQRLRDLHSNIYGDHIISYHGQMMPNNMYIQRGLNPYNDKRNYGFYSSSSNDVANTYNFIEDSPTFKLYTHFNKPYVINANKANAGRTLTDRTYLQKSKEGYDGVIIKDVYDVGSRRNRLNGASGLADDIIATSGKSKLADAVTYDDKGIRIPLGKRDNFKLNDIRYSIGQQGLPYYYDPVTKQWNFSTVSQDVKQGINNLKEWMNNSTYRVAAEANKAEAEAMGLSYVPYYERPEYTRALQNPNIKFKNLNSSVGGESNLSGEVTINTGTTLNPTLVVRHEMGHVAGLGKISESAATNPDNTLLLKELKYLRHKSNQVYKEGSEYAGQVDLNRNSFEGIQNARDFGEELGIKIGQEYPGYEKALEIINSYPDTGFKAGLKKMFRLDKEHMRYVWKALAGTLFTLAATLYNTNK